MVEKELKSVSDLPGVGAIGVEKLKLAGFFTLASVANASTQVVMDALDTSLPKADAIIGSALNAVGGRIEDNFVDGDKVGDDVVFLKIGVPEFDDLLGGGVHTGEITEFFAPFGEGKTQIAFQLCVNIFDDPSFEGRRKVIYVDAEGSYRKKRIFEMAEAKGLDPSAVLKNIKVVRPLNSRHQSQLCQQSEEIIKKGEVGLIIVDSIMSRFRTEYKGRQSLPDRQHAVGVMLISLANMAMTYNIVVMATNQVHATPNVTFGDPDKPIGGHVVGHICKTRVKLQRGAKGVKWAKLIDSPYLPDGSIQFKVTKKGIESVNKK